jgi:hypothetical protein
MGLFRKRLRGKKSIRAAIVGACLSGIAALLSAAPLFETGRPALILSLFCGGAAFGSSMAVIVMRLREKDREAE